LVVGTTLDVSSTDELSESIVDITLRRDETKPAARARDGRLNAAGRWRDDVINEVEQSLNANVSPKDVSQPKAPGFGNLSIHRVNRLGSSVFHPCASVAKIRFP
jgi:hypothetical protein